MDLQTLDEQNKNESVYFLGVRELKQENLKKKKKQQIWKISLVENWRKAMPKVMPSLTPQACFILKCYMSALLLLIKCTHSAHEGISLIIIAHTFGLEKRTS